jgi:glutathione S-transferase
MSTTGAAVEALVLRRTYKAPRERVFDAWVKPEIFRRWMGPSDVAVREMSFDARLGGKYRIVMVAPDGERFVVFGTIRDYRRPERLSYTWQWEDDDGAPEGNETLLTLDFHDRDGDTELVLTHENFASAESRDRHNEGWSNALEKLAPVVAGSSDRGFTITGMDLSGFMVKDAPRAIAFYRSVLGFEPVTVYDGDRGAEYEFPDGSIFGLWGAGGQIPFQPSNGILFAVDDMDAAVAALKARDIPILMQLDLANCTMTMFADTEGNTICLHKRKA